MGDRMRIRRYYLTYGQDGFALRVADQHVVQQMCEAVVETTLTLLGHPCCGRGLGRWEPISDLAFRLLNLPYRFLPDRVVTHLPVSDEHAEVLDPVFAKTCREDFS